jgi:hypothetical protein
MSNNVIHVKSWHSCQIMLFMSNHVIHVTIHDIHVIVHVHCSSKVSKELFSIMMRGSKSAFTAFGRRLCCRPKAKRTQMAWYSDFLVKIKADFIAIILGHANLRNTVQWQKNNYKWWAINGPFMPSLLYSKTIFCADTVYSSCSKGPSGAAFAISVSAPNHVFCQLLQRIVERIVPRFHRSINGKIWHQSQTFTNFWKGSFARKSAFEKVAPRSDTRLPQQQ